ncbi:MAG: DNA recombination protein RmuC [Candidatus Omnitrophica bacterium]|nr:DNA recombination protein RmuC [Candidatus Omnitrophota bacterium]
MTWLIVGIFIAGFLFIVFLVFKIVSVMNRELRSVTRQVDDGLKEVYQVLQEGHRSVGDRLDSATKVFGDVQKSLGRLEEAQKHIYEISKDISSLQELLRAPKFRGQMGETLLENLLAQVLPREYFTMQHRFKSSDAVDAVVRLGERLVPVDAKFSLENFKKLLEAKSEEEKSAFRKKFIQDVKNRIDEVASKYILPQENTYDFALMYIPAENVYYEVIIKEDIFSYSLTKKVIPVSPNTFYAYLQIICLGLKGMKIEENAKAILKNLSMVSVEIAKFKEDFDILGGHLSNAGSKYSDSQKKLDKFLDRISHIQDSKQIESK